MLILGAIQRFIKSPTPLVLIGLLLLLIFDYLIFLNLGEDSRSTREHASQYLDQLGEASSSEALVVRMFPLSLTGTSFSWFASLAPG